MKKFLQFLRVLTFCAFRNLTFFFLLAFPLFANWQEELRIKIEQSDYPAWMLDQIREELEPFGQTKVTLQDIYATLQTYSDRGFILCRILDNGFWWECQPPEANHDFRATMFVDGIKALCQTVTLPNMIFLVYIGESFTDTANKAPVFSWCKHQEWSKRTVSIPDYEAIAGNTNFLQQAQLGSQSFPWESKENKAFWRGGSAGGWGFEFMPRIKLAQISNEFPELIDAKLTGVFPGQDYSFFSQFLGSAASVSESLRYKYQILVDGHVSAFSRAYWQLFSNSVIFKNSSPWYQWFYRELRPYEHYIPYEADASDLVEKITWAMEHDDFARSITQNANDFAKKNLKHSDIMLYVYLLLKEYAKIMVY